MPNGELRFRLMGSDGNGYIRTVATDGGWQMSHSHSTFTETYIVERKWMILAYEEIDGQAALRTFMAGEVVTVAIGKVHNVYLPGGAVIHTVKHGNAGDAAPWHPEPRFDRVTQSIRESDLLGVFPSIHNQP